MKWGRRNPHSCNRIGYVCRISDPNGKPEECYGRDHCQHRTNEGRERMAIRELKPKESNRRSGKAQHARNQQPGAHLHSSNPRPLSRSLRHRPDALAASAGPAQRHEHYAGWPPACEQNYVTSRPTLTCETSGLPFGLVGPAQAAIGKDAPAGAGVSSREARRPPPIRPGGQRACPDCSCG